tara:strand:+ start:978 stop:1172 length:195 start_codon:yes stop_codon:yes gene_type:complete
MRIIHKGGYKKIYPEKFAEVREQIQEDIISLVDSQNNGYVHAALTGVKDELCQIVVNNFKKFKE